MLLPLLSNCSKIICCKQGRDMNRGRCECHHPRYWEQLCQVIGLGLSASLVAPISDLVCRISILKWKCSPCCLVTSQRTPYGNTHFREERLDYGVRVGVKINHILFIKRSVFRISLIWGSRSLMPPSVLRPAATTIYSRPSALLSPAFLGSFQVS